MEMRFLNLILEGPFSSWRVEAKREAQELSMAVFFLPCAGTQSTVRKNVANPWREAEMREREQSAVGIRNPASSSP